MYVHTSCTAFRMFLFCMEGKVGFDYEKCTIFWLMFIIADDFTLRCVRVAIYASMADVIVRKFIIIIIIMLPHYVPYFFYKLCLCLIWNFSHLYAVAALISPVRGGRAVVCLGQHHDAPIDAPSAGVGGAIPVAQIILAGVLLSMCLWGREYYWHIMVYVLSSEYSYGCT